MIAKPMLLSTVALLAMISNPSGASASDSEDILGLYAHYDVGYDANYADDWFFDYYEYDSNAAATQSYYPFFAEFDYRAGLFDWEEDGLFDENADGTDENGDEHANQSENKTKTENKTENKTEAVRTTRQ